MEEVLALRTATARVRSGLGTDLRFPVEPRSCIGVGGSTRDRQSAARYPQLRTPITIVEDTQERHGLQRRSANGLADGIAQRREGQHMVD